MSYENPTPLERSIICAIREARPWTNSDIEDADDAADAIAAAPARVLFGRFARTGVPGRAPGARIVDGKFLSDALRLTKPIVPVYRDAASARPSTRSGEEIEEAIHKPARDGGGHYLREKHGFTLEGFRIEGDIDLSLAEIPVPVTFAGCEFTGGVDLSRARCRNWVFIEGKYEGRAQLCRAGWFKADMAFFDGSLVLSDLEGLLPLSDELAKKARDLAIDLSDRRPIDISLHRVRTEGNLFLNRVVLDDGLNINGAVIGDDLFLQDGFTAFGRVDVVGASIGQQFSCSGGRFINEGGVSVDANGAMIGNSVFFGRSVQSFGGIKFTGATIGGQLACSQARFINKGGIALNCDMLTCKESVFLRHSEVEGRVDFATARIGGAFDCRYSKFSSSERSARDGRAAPDEGDVDRKSKRGRKIRDDGVVIRLTNSAINGDLRLSDIDRLEGLVDLRQARAGVLVDDDRHWRKPKCKFLLDGFTYDRIGDDAFGGGGTAIVRAAERLKWLDSQPKGEIRGPAFKPHPFTQLGQVLSAMGHTAHAKQIMFERDKRIAENENNFIVSRPRNWIYALPIAGYLITVLFNVIAHWTVGFGHLPQRAALTVAAYLALGSVIFGAAYDRGMMGPAPDSFVAASSDPGAPEAEKLNVVPFDPFIYAADVFLPAFDLGQEKYWMPMDNQERSADAGACAAGDQSVSDAPGTVLAKATLDPLAAARRLKAGAACWLQARIDEGVARDFYLFSVVSGWLLSTLIVAGVSGLLSKTR